MCISKDKIWCKLSLKKQLQIYNRPQGIFNTDSIEVSMVYQLLLSEN